MFKYKHIIAILVFSTNLLAGYENDNSKLGNISMTVGIWKPNVTGEIYNNMPSSTSLENDLGFKAKNITTFDLELRNDFSWLPNVSINYFKLSNSSNAILNGQKFIDNTSFNGSVSSLLRYSQIDAILYGYLYNGPYQLDLGIKVKKIDYSHELKENISNGSGSVISINGPDALIVLPHVALKVNLDFINTVLKVQTSMLSIGDVEVRDYSYSINYRVMRNIYVSYGYKYNSWKSTNKNNDHEKYDINIKGNYLSCKILF